MSTWSPFEPKGLWEIWETSCWYSEKAGENLVGEKGERWDTRDMRVSHRPTNNLHSGPPAHPSLSPWSQISICGSNDPASRPCGQSRSRPVIKMKWAADPMVPFRRVEHWPRDLYLIDQPVQREKSCFPPERPVPHSTALFQSKCLCEKRKNCFFNSPVFLPAVLVLLQAVRITERKKPLIWCGELTQASYLI